jgi:carbonic anhydrase
VLGCLDSRVPAEIVFDAGIGDVFVGRVAGNVVNDDMLGSMEFACGVSGAKVVLVLGHTACGAVKGAIDDVVLGNLTGLLARIKPAIPATKFDGEKSSKNALYVDAVARTNVVLGLGEMRRRSPMLEDPERKEPSKSRARCMTCPMAWWTLSGSCPKRCRLKYKKKGQARRRTCTPLLMAGD